MTGLSPTRFGWKADIRVDIHTEFTSTASAPATPTLGAVDAAELSDGEVITGSVSDWIVEADVDGDGIDDLMFGDTTVVGYVPSSSDFYE